MTKEKRQIIPYAPVAGDLCGVCAQPGCVVVGRIQRPTLIRDRATGKPLETIVGQVNIGFDCLTEDEKMELTGI